MGKKTNLGGLLYIPFALLYTILMFTTHFSLENILEPYFATYADMSSLAGTIAYQIHSFFAGGATEMVALAVTTFFIYLTLIPFRDGQDKHILASMGALTGMLMAQGILMGFAIQLSYQLFPIAGDASTLAQTLASYGYHQSVIPAIVLFTIWSLYLNVQTRINKSLLRKGKQKNISQGTTTSDKANEARLQRLAEADNNDRLSIDDSDFQSHPKYNHS